MNWKSIVLGGLVVLGFIMVTGYSSMDKKKIVYIKTGELYAGFEMKKELENTYLTVQKGRKHQLDSLELELKILNKRFDVEGEKKELVNIFEVKRENYLLKKQQFEQDNAQMQQQYTANIQKQLNQYVSDYGKENECDYILGADGSGSIMFAKETDDITKEVLIFINNKYKGVK